jgi:signal transduction histidine kinase
METIKQIEVFFLRAIILFAMVSLPIVFVSDVVNRGWEFKGIYGDIALFISSLISFALFRLKFYRSSALLLTILSIVATTVVAINNHYTVDTTAPVIVVIGFFLSILFRGILMYSMHLLSLLSICTIYGFISTEPELFFLAQAGDAYAIGITYSILYGIISYSAYVLKIQYDKLYQAQVKNMQAIHEKNREIEFQNKELSTQKSILDEMNQNLERLVESRTTRIREQSSILYRYAFNNAHKVRGPVARILGLVQLSEIKAGLTDNEILAMVKTESYQLDKIIKEIGSDLELQDFPIEEEQAQN